MMTKEICCRERIIRKMTKSGILQLLLSIPLDKQQLLGILIDFISTITTPKKDNGMKYPVRTSRTITL